MFVLEMYRIMWGLTKLSVPEVCTGDVPLYVGVD